MNKSEYEEMKKKIEEEEITAQTTLIYISGKPQKIVSHKVLYKHFGTNSKNYVRNVPIIEVCEKQ